MKTVWECALQGAALRPSARRHAVGGCGSGTAPQLHLSCSMQLHAWRQDKRQRLCPRLPWATPAPHSCIFSSLQAAALPQPRCAAVPWSRGHRAPVSPPGLHC